MTTGYAASYFSIAIDQANSHDSPGKGHAPAFIRSIEGGHLQASIISETRGGDIHQLKHIGTVDAQPIVLETGLASSPELLKWIQQTWDNDTQPRSGRIEHGAPGNGGICNRISQEFYDSYLTEVTFPAMSAMSESESAYLKCTIQPGTVKYLEGDGQLMNVPTGYNQLNYAKSHFTFEIGNQAIPFKKVDSFTVKQHVKKLYVGRKRHAELIPGGLEISNLAVYVSTPDGAFFQDWYRERIESTQGMNEVAADRPGSLVYRTQNNEPLFEIQFKNVGIYSLNIEKSVAGSTDLKLFKAGLYVEGLKLIVKTNSPGFD